MSIRLAILGSGQAARFHFAAAQAAPEVEVVAIGARNVAAAEQVAAGSGLRVLPPDEAVRLESVDGVILAVPAAVQPRLAVAAFAAGKHVLCEKPLAASGDAAAAIEQAWRDAGTVGMVNFCYRLVPAIAEFRHRLDDGICGELSWIEAQWVLSSRLDSALPYNWKADAASGGGALRNFGSHVFDYLFHGRGDVRVESAWLRTLTPSRRDASGIEHTNTADEVMTATFAVSGWCPVVVHISLVTRPQIGHRLVARGSAGTLETWNGSPTSPAGPFHCAFHPDRSSAAGGQEVQGGGHEALATLFEPIVTRFARAIRDGGDPSPGIEDGVRAVRIADAVAATARLS